MNRVSPRSDQENDKNALFNKKKPGIPPRKASSVMRMPNVYLIKELPTQKAIISPKI